MTCRWLSDDFSEVCVNGDCPCCAEWCPVTEHPEICRWAEDGGTTSSDPPSAAHLPMKGKAFGEGADDG